MPAVLFGEFFLVLQVIARRCLPWVPKLFCSLSSFLPECQRFSFSLSNQNSLLFVISWALASSLRFSVYIFWSLLIHFGFLFVRLLSFLFLECFFFFKSQGLVYLGWFWICFVAKDNHGLLSLPPPPNCRDCRYVLYLISFSVVTQTQGLGMPGKHCANCQPQPLLLFILGAGLTMEPRLALNSQFYPTSWVLGLQPGLHPHSQPLEFIPNPSWPSGHRWFPALVFTNRRPFSIPKLPSRLCPKDP